MTSVLEKQNQFAVSQTTYTPIFVLKTLIKELLLQVFFVLFVIKFKIGLNDLQPHAKYGNTLLFMRHQCVHTHDDDFRHRSHKRQVCVTLKPENREHEI